jgi:hypothetical protein
MQQPPDKVVTDKCFVRQTMFSHTQFGGECIAWIVDDVQRRVRDQSWVRVRLVNDNDGSQRLVFVNIHRTSQSKAQQLHDQSLTKADSSLRLSRTYREGKTNFTNTPTGLRSIVRSLNEKSCRQ